MKFKFCLLICLVHNLCTAQLNGSVFYEKEWVDLFTASKDGKELKNRDPKLYKEYKEIEKQQAELTKQLKYNLRFNESESLFFLDDMMEKDNSQILALATGPFQGSYYQNNKSGKILWQLDSYDGTYLISLKSPEWQLVNENKIINGYSCYKATTKVNNNIIIAWYSSEIPLNYGPLGYNGLPGLILSLKIRGEKFTFQKIEFYKNFQKIDAPHTGKHFTIDEFNERFSKMNSR
ncbi:GLPGLI family protein [Salegentibacter sp. HM20]